MALVLCLGAYLMYASVARQGKAIHAQGIPDISGITEPRGHRAAVG